MARGGLLARCQCCGEPQADKRAAGEPALEAQEGPIAAEQITRGPGREREHPVAYDAETHEGEAENENLPMQPATRGIDELRQEGEEEDRRLRIEEIDDEAVTERALQSPRPPLLTLQDRDPWR